MITDVHERNRALVDLGKAWKDLFGDEAVPMTPDQIESMKKALIDQGCSIEQCPTCNRDWKLTFKGSTI